MDFDIQHKENSNMRPIPKNKLKDLLDLLSFLSPSSQLFYKALVHCEEEWSVIVTCKVQYFAVTLFFLLKEILEENAGWRLLPGNSKFFSQDEFCPGFGGQSYGC